MLKEADWQRIVRRIRTEKFLPFISDRIYFPPGWEVVAKWAEAIDYPFAVEKNAALAQVAQFLSATSRDDLSAKEDFLEYIKRDLLDSFRETAPADQAAFLDTLEQELWDLSFSEVAARLGFPRYENELENPLRILAALPLPIYITSSSHDFLEAALRDAGKEPRTEICYWHDGLEKIHSVFKQDDAYDPTPESPLVYHLHGLDGHPSSLVLTEDDYLDFLVKISEDLDLLPLRIRAALVDSSLLLLGYQLGDWEFKVMFRGLIKTKRDSRRLFNISIQYDLEENGEAAENSREVQDYLERYFNKADFDIYWGDPRTFIQELWQHWEAT